MRRQPIDDSRQSEALPIVAVLACDRFGPYQLSIPCIVFGNYFGNSLPDKPLFDVRICSVGAGIIRSEFGLEVNTPHGLEVFDEADVIVIPFWRDPAEVPQQSLLDRLVSAHERGAKILGLCYGSYPLAYAGLLDNRRASTHWEMEADFAERFPRVKLDKNALYVEEDGLITSAGAGAGLDCCLHVVRSIYGSAEANHVARRMVIPTYREGRQTQKVERLVPTSKKDMALVSLLGTIRADPVRSYKLDCLAGDIGMSRSTFTRYFRKMTGMSFGEWLLSERLKRSQELLETSLFDIETVAEKTGFQNANSLRQHFKEHFGASPQEWRQAYRRRLAAEAGEARGADRI